jgi:asparagine synthase (glutamine-hydrolysing)
VCGIAALFRGTSSVDPAAITAMTDAVAHRGPDGRGEARLGPAGRVGGGDPSWQVALGHRRLSIIDLSTAAGQPMTVAGRTIVFNGEIYNYVELRDELRRRGRSFTTESDTEVLLAAYAEWGDECLARLRGMWAFVLVDPVRGVALLSRDRLGIKPLHLARAPGGALAAVSEPKQLRHLPGFRLRPDRDSLQLYLESGYEDPARTFFADVTVVPAGTSVVVDLHDGAVGQPRPYWFPERVRPLHTDAEEGARVFAAALDEAVRIHLRSDVPVGCALSGGLDSSSVAVLAARHSVDLHTFSVVFPGEAIDERAHVQAVLSGIRARSHYVSPTAAGFAADLDRFLAAHDEPVGSASQYAAYALARTTREAAVPVSLNGQGGDEILGGYWQSYLLHLRGLASSGHLLGLARQLVGAALPGGNRALLEQLAPMLRRYRHRLRAGASASRRVGEILGLDPAARRVHEIRGLYLPRLLRWDDRNFMAFGVEGRYPFLDHEVVEVALSLEASALYRDGWTKLPLRLGVPDLPESIRWRKSKLGFETPQASWLAGALRPVLEVWLTGDSPAWSHTPREGARALAARVFARPADLEESQGLFRLYVVDRWLRSM